MTLVLAKGVGAGAGAEAEDEGMHLADIRQVGSTFYSITPNYSL